MWYRMTDNLAFDSFPRLSESSAASGCRQRLPKATASWNQRAYFACTIRRGQTDWVFKWVPQIQIITLGPETKAGRCRRAEESLACAQREDKTYIFNLDAAADMRRKHTLCTGDGASLTMEVWGGDGSTSCSDSIWNHYDVQSGTFAAFLHNWYQNERTRLSLISIPWWIPMMSSPATTAEWAHLNSTRFPCSFWSARYTLWLPLPRTSGDPPPPPRRRNPRDRTRTTTTHPGPGSPYL